MGTRRENSIKQASNSPLLLLAEGMVELIGKWRSEISETKDLRPKIKPNVLKGFLEMADGRGLPAILVAYTILACEWSFRIRRMTDEDIERVLYEMEAELSKPLNPIFTPFQSHILIKSIEPTLKKQMKSLRIRLSLGIYHPVLTPSGIF